jgi:PAS domain S-box-containing protein
MRVNWKIYKEQFTGWKGYLFAVAIVALATWLKHLAQPNIIPPDAPILYILSIVLTATFFGLGPALFCCVLSLGAYNYYFLPPIHVLGLKTEQWPVLSVFFVISVIISYLSSNLRERTREAKNELAVRRQREAELISYREHLEELVRQRTEELEKTNLELSDEVIAHKRDEDELQKAHDELEIRIQERTRELGKVNRVLEIERQRFNDVLESLPVYVVLLTPDYHVPFANRFFRERFGDSNGRRCYEYLFNRTEPCEDCETYKVLKTGAPLHWEWQGPDGRNYDIYDFPFHDVDGSPLILEMGIDVTERKRAQEELNKTHAELELRVRERTRELSETRDYLDNLFNYANAPIIVWDPDFRINRFNHAFERLTGYTAEEVLGKKLDILFPADSFDQSMKYIQLAASGERLETTEIPIKHKDGNIYILLWNSANIYDGEGKNVVATIAQGHDITKRKQAEEELQRINEELEGRVRVRTEEVTKERQRLYNVLEGLPAMICLLTPDYQVAFANRSFREKFGEFRGQHCYEYCFGYDSPCDFCEAYRVLETGKPYHWEFRTPDGKTIIDSYDIPFTDTDGSPMILEMNIDITERKQAEQALKLEEARLDALLRLSQMSEATVDEIAGFILEHGIALTRSKIGFVGFLNEDETVYTLNAVSKDVVKECRVEGDPLQWHVVGAGIWADAIRERRTLYVNDYNNPHLRKKGIPPGHPPVSRLIVVPLIDGDRIVAVAGMGNKDSDYDSSDERQITLLMRSMWNNVQRSMAREALEKAHDELEQRVEQRTRELQEIEHDLNRAQEVAHIGSWRMDVQHNVLLWSDETHRMFGIPRGTPMTFETFLACVHPDDREWVENKWQAALQGEEYIAEHRIIIGDEIKWVSERAELEFDEQGMVKGGFGTVQDITDRKKAERMKDEFIGLVSHELRTPMTIITGSLKTAIASGISEEDKELLVQNAIEGAASLSAILENLLELSRYQTGRLQLRHESVSMPKIVHDIIMQLKNQGGENAFREDFPDDLPVVDADPLRVERILYNLMENAVKYSPEGSEIKVFARQDNTMVVTGVVDKGSGISAENYERLFEMFERFDTGTRSKGLGLGLVVCKRLVEAQGGKIWVESAPGKGSTFYFTLPVRKKVK